MKKDKVRNVIILSIILAIFSCKNEKTKVAETAASVIELKRISSADKKVEAVLVERKGDATVADGNMVFVVRPGEKITEDGLRFFVFNADHCDSVDIEWKQNQQLLINYKKARIFNFRNFWNSGSVESWHYVVEVILNCTSGDSQLRDDDMHPRFPGN